MQRGRKTFKQTLNEALRRGLQHGTRQDETPFEVAARPLGLRKGIDPARLHDLDDELEIDDFLRKTKALQDAAS